MIQKITWEEIYEVWSKELWPTRTSKIESTSAMNFLSGYNMDNMKNTPTLFGYVFGGKVVGVNSGHRCADGSYRSRGLYVKPQFRGLGLGVALLKATLKQATLEESKFIWSLPRMDSWKTYNSVGFKLASSWHLTETSDNNAYCYKSLQ